jgi:hypothetical protein
MAEDTLMMRLATLLAVILALTASFGCDGNKDQRGKRTVSISVRGSSD